MIKTWTIVDPKTGRFVRQYKRLKTKCKCGRIFYTTLNRLNDGRGKFCSKECFYEFRYIVRENEHHFWSGDNPKYDTLHKWIACKFGQPMFCEWCGFRSDNKYQIQWANITGKYNRERKNWARICAKCHYHYDRKK